MYFGLYQISSRYQQFDALPYEAPCAGPSLLATLRALFRRIFH
jgi:hypothetical protein